MADEMERAERLIRIYFINPGDDHVDFATDYQVIFLSQEEAEEIGAEEGEKYIDLGGILYPTPETLYTVLLSQTEYDAIGDTLDLLSPEIEARSEEVEI